MKRTITPHNEEGLNLDGTQRRVVFNCKTFNSANNSSRCRKIADEMPGNFARLIRREEKAQKVEQFEAFKITRREQQKLDRKKFRQQKRKNKR